MAVSIRDPERMQLVCELVRETGVGAADLIGSCASRRLGRPLGGPGGPGGPRGPGGLLKGLKKVLKWSILSGFFGCRTQARQPPGGCSSRVPGTCQQKPLGLGFRKGAMVAAVAQLYLGLLAKLRL